MVFCIGVCVQCMQWWCVVACGVSWWFVVDLVFGGGLYLKVGGEKVIVVCGVLDRGIKR